MPIPKLEKAMAVFVGRMSMAAVWLRAVARAGGPLTWLVVLRRRRGAGEALRGMAGALVARPPLHGYVGRRRGNVAGMVKVTMGN